MSEQFARSPGRLQAQDALAAFVQRFVPDDDVRRPTDDFLDYAQHQAPALLVQLWAECGIGFYGEQRIAILDPGEWMPTLQVWLGTDVRSFPFAVTSFGHVYHVSAGAGPERIECLDPHFQTNTVVPGGLASFFAEHLPGSTSHVADLEGPRSGALARLGPLAPGEIYFFEPVLALGGTVSPDSLAKGDGRQHLEQIHAQVVRG